MEGRGGDRGSSISHFKSWSVKVNIHQGTRSAAKLLPEVEGWHNGDLRKQGWRRRHSLAKWDTPRTVLTKRGSSDAKNETRVLTHNCCSDGLDQEMMSPFHGMDSVPN